MNGTANAAPPTATPVQYRLTQTPTSVVLDFTNAKILRTADSVEIQNSTGATVFRMPLSYRLEYREFPIDSAVAGNTVTLTPSKNLARSRALSPVEVDPIRQVAAQQKVDAPRTKQERDDQALARFNQELGAGLTISSLVGLAIGAIAGGVIGCLLGLPLLGVGCLPGIPLGASLGSIVGIILGGGGSAIVGGINYFNTINSPFVPPKN
ncbi:glycine zipper family protein [Gordonia sp. NPDC003429]